MTLSTTYTKIEIDYKLQELQESISSLGGGGGGDLSNYYTKSETYSKTEVDDLIADIPVVDTSNLVPYNGATQNVNIGAFYFESSAGFIKTGGTSNQALTADGGVFDLNTKADLVGGKVPKAQSQPSTMVMDNSTYVITFTDATGAVQTIDLPLESLFKDANYDAQTKSLIVTLQDGTTRTIPLTDLVDLPEIVLATTNPSVNPTTGQKVYFNTSLGKVWFNVSGAWVFAGNLISDTEKTNLSNAYTHSQATGNPHNTTKADIGLGNVDNTSDLNKPISTATQSALNNKADLVGGKVPTSQLPSYVDDVLEFANLASFPATGENGKIYIAIDTNLTYRWGGSSYVVMSSSLALGETSSTAYRGDRGKIAYDHSQTTGNPHNTTKNDIGLGNVDNTSDLNKPISTATQTALNLKENVANKATDLSSPDNTKYPTTLAVANENKKATITVELISQLTTNFYAPNALRINSTALISGSGTLTLKVNDVAYTLTDLIPQGAKITAETTSASVYNLISIYE